ncbi:hypothetical protein FH972_024534 [Carpinus fangiana]|uniref:SRP9 domain-containing protein n=1 Tax=Carpinus fangiana TaxID=176857 RepID=A0A5N6KYP1_9ROSI|nr:hypothetical protein FH972_024534 [Carpinus fangiana]
MPPNPWISAPSVNRKFQAFATSTMSPMRPISSSQDWLEQSSLLLKAHPSTTRISSKYSIGTPITSPKSKKLNSEPRNTGPPGSGPTPSQSTQPRATFTLKTFDPVSGVCLKYQTDKAAEVGRLVAYLGSLGRSMCGLPDKVEDVTMIDTAAGGEENADTTPASVAATESKGSSGQSGQQQGGGGGKKKKKGKK